MGGIRTVLYNYLYARQHKGDFILRIEDTDQSRFVPGAEEYIFDCLKWVGLVPDESPEKPGKYGPYRQSERKALYREYAEKLVSDGKAYYAFDTPEELDKMRNSFRTETNPSPQYDHSIRLKMRNSLSLEKSEVKKLLDAGTAHVVRIKIDPHESIEFTDLIRGDVHFDTTVLDDKVLLKADGMPTYHLAVVVDDFLMKISHAFRGEEWLPSAPVHILLWKWLFGLDQMPQWAHLPLILGPNGKLSKRDGAKYGFPVFAMSWNDPNGETVTGFREKGFLPEAFINFLALLGWNDGTEQELFTKDELIKKFSIERVHSGGAKFDYEKAKWFNHEWIKRSDASILVEEVKRIFQEKSIEINDDKFLEKIIGLVKDRCTIMSDFYDHASFFFVFPEKFDTDAVKPKWTEEKRIFFESLAEGWSAVNEWNAAFLEDEFKKLAAEKGIKPGELQLPLRVMLVGGKFGPPVFHIAEVLGKEEAIKRVRHFPKLI